MALEPVIDAAAPGLWREPGWKRGAPGVYALVVGVSSYPHLAGGAQPADETFGLGQLSVSAGTALAVFEWLRSDYRRADRPVVWCQVLLAPSPAESERFEKRGMTKHFGEPSYRNLQNALQRWSAVLPEDSAAHARCRTFFFFSGHGLQANWRPLLLPSDYLDPSYPKPQLQNCVSTRELKEWMDSDGAGEHVAFFDACRNEFAPLASKGATANTIMGVNSAAGQPPGVVATFAATAPKTTAYQSAAEEEELTFFGTALLEGLRGGRGEAVFSDTSDLHVEFNTLVDYVKPRVNVLLRKHNEQLEQTGRPSLEPSDTKVLLTDLTIARTVHRGLESFSAPASPQSVVDKRFLNVDPSEIPLADLRDFEKAHRRFGHEYLAGLWSPDVFSLHALDGRGTPPDTYVIVRRTEYRATEDGSAAILRVDLDLPGGSGGLLAVFQSPFHVRGGLLAMPLPTDPFPVRLTLSLQGSPNGPTLLYGVEGRLGFPSTTNEVYEYLWQLSERANHGSFAAAAAIADPGILRDAVEQKRSCTTAAFASAIILARGGRILTVGDWTRNLMNWFTDVPDGAVLWAESLRTAMAKGERAPFGVPEPLQEMADAMASLASRGIPFFAETLDMADELLRHLARRRAELSESSRLSLDRVRRMIDLGLQIASPGGSFLLCSGQPRPAQLGPGEEPLTVPEILRILRPGRPDP